MAKYGRKAAEKVEKALHERKRGTLKSGKSGKTVKSRKQAIAIGLSEARRAGGKVPPPPKQRRTRKGAAAKTRTTKRKPGARRRSSATKGAAAK